MRSLASSKHFTRLNKTLPLTKYNPKANRNFTIILLLFIVNYVNLQLQSTDIIRQIFQNENDIGAAESCNKNASLLNCSIKHDSGTNPHILKSTTEFSDFYHSRK